MKVTCIYTDAHGKSAFGERDLPLTDKGQFGRFSELQAAPGILFREVDASYDSGWHCAPNPLYLIILSGTVEIVTGGGEARRFGPGAVVRAEDREGEGHLTRAVGGEPVRCIVVNLT